MVHNIEQNKENAQAFYQLAFDGNPKQAVEMYVGDQYIQHNPVVSDGKEGFIKYFMNMAEDYKDKSMEFLRIIGEGDLVAVHTHQIWPDQIEYVTMDFFRFDEKGKIVEHWDAIQKVPLTSENDNSMF